MNGIGIAFVYLNNFLRGAGAEGAGRVILLLLLLLVVVDLPPKALAGELSYCEFEAAENFLSAGLRIWKEHIKSWSMLMIAPALSNSPQ